MEKSKTGLVKKRKAEAAGFWNFYARIYDLLNTFSPYIKMQKAVIKSLQLINNLTIIDASCGTGNTLKRLLVSRKEYFGLKLVGLDFSRAMLQRAKKKLAGIAQLRLWLGNFDNLPEPNTCPTEGEKLTQDEALGFGKKYDRIISVNSLYISPNPQKTLRHWYESLEDGGLAVIANPFVPKLGPIWREFFMSLWRDKNVKDLMVFILLSPAWLTLTAINVWIAYQGRKNVYHFLEPEALEALVIAAGFKVLSRELIYGGGSVLLCLQKETGSAIRRAQTPSEIEEVYRLRYTVYCEEMKSVDSALFSNRQEIDCFDLYAIHFIVRDGDEIVGSARVITDSGMGFLLEEFFCLPVEISNQAVRKKTLEISRVALIPEYRGGGYFIELMSEVVCYGNSHGYFSYIGVSTARIWNTFIKNKWRIAIWDSYIEYHNTISCPAIISRPIKSHE